MDRRVGVRGSIPVSSTSCEGVEARVDLLVGFELSSSCSDSECLLCLVDRLVGVLGTCAVSGSSREGVELLVVLSVAGTSISRVGV